MEGGRRDRVGLRCVVLAWPDGACRGWQYEGEREEDNGGEGHEARHCCGRAWRVVVVVVVVVVEKLRGSERMVVCCEGMGPVCLTAFIPSVGPRASGTYVKKCSTRTESSWVAST